MGTFFRKSLKRFEIENQPRFLTFSCYRRLPLLDNNDIRDLFEVRLDAARKQHGFRLHAWVLMPEHVHMILTPSLPEHPVDIVLKSLKQSVGKRVIIRWKNMEAPILQRMAASKGRLRFWQAGGGYDRNIRDEEEMLEKVSYLHANPVRRGLVDSPAGWKWSSARWYEGIRDGELIFDTWG
ncbi:MAG: transposase [Planctomycetes bacterium]|nr:transposase [Planctomycetota bacterium]